MARRPTDGSTPSDNAPEPPRAVSPAAAQTDKNPLSQRRPQTVNGEGEQVEEAGGESTQQNAPVVDPGSAAKPTPVNRRIGIIGAGLLGGAMCRGLVKAAAAPANRIIVSDHNATATQRLHTELGIRVAESNVQIAKFTDIILLAVEPSAVPTVLDEIADALKRDGGKPLPLLICLSAGIRIETIEAHLKDPIPVIRAVPNIAVQVGQGACAYCMGAHTDDTHYAPALAVLQAVGTAVEVSEALLPAVTALSGAGPAYVYLMIEALVDGGVKVGLPREIAYQLATQTVLGATQLAIDTQMHPAQLRDMIAAPASAAITGIASLEHSGVRSALIHAIELAANRTDQPD